MLRIDRRSFYISYASVGKMPMPRGTGFQPVVGQCSALTAADEGPSALPEAKPALSASGQKKCDRARRRLHADNGAGLKRQRSLKVIGACKT